MDPKIIAFFLISAALTVTPGVDMALITRNTLRRGRRSAFVTTLGITTGLPVHALFSSVGLSLILSRSAAAFEVVKFLGAGYLIYLGVRTFISAGKAEAGDAHGPQAEAGEGAQVKEVQDQLAEERTQHIWSRRSGTSASRVPTGRARLAGFPLSYPRVYLEGLLTNLLNPKVALFYLTFLPQFMSPGDPVVPKALLLGGIHAGLGVVWLTIYAYFINRLSETLNRPSVKRNIERVTGAILVAFGLRLVWEQR